MPPETSRKPIESVSFPTGGDHSLRLTVAFHVAHTAPLLHPPRKLYWTYSIAHIEGKSDVLTGVLEKYQTSHEVIVGQQTLESLYSKPAEFVLWQVVRNPDYKPLKKLDDAALAVTKDAAATGNAKPKKGKKEPTKELIVRARPRSASDPDLKASFTMDPIMGLQRQHSQSPPLCQGVSQWDAPLSLIKPHPHHFDHPEKHVPLHTFGRSMSSLSDVSIARSKTPPSPHHFDKPLATVVKNGVVKQKKPLALANSSLKGFGALGRNVVVPIDKSLRISIANEFVSSRPGTGKSDDRRIRWDQEEHVGVRNRHWNARQHQLERLANDQTMDRPKPLFDKRRLETIHVPVTKVGLDLSSFFMDNCTASCVVKGVVDGHECDITVSIDELLLSTMQQEALKPFLVTLSTLSQMPVGRDDHAALYHFSNAENCGLSWRGMSTRLLCGVSVKQGWLSARNILFWAGW